MLPSECVLCVYQLMQLFVVCPGVEKTRYLKNMRKNNQSRFLTDASSFDPCHKIYVSAIPNNFSGQFVSVRFTEYSEAVF